MKQLRQTILCASILSLLLSQPTNGIAQKLEAEVGITVGTMLPNGHLQKLNLLKPGPFAGFSVSLSYPIGNKAGLLFSFVPTIAHSAKNNFRIASDCISEPCVSYSTTNDSVRGRDMRFFEMAVSAGGFLSVTNNWKVKLAFGISWNPIAWAESADFVNGVADKRFDVYSPASTISYRRFTGLARLSIIRYFNVKNNPRLFLELTSQFGLSPRMRIPGYKMWKKDFSFRPLLLGLAVGIRI